MNSGESGVTKALAGMRDGDPEAVERLYEQTYAELRRIARAHLRARPRDTLNTTALVHEAYLKLFDRTTLEFKDRVHFLAVSARAMRQILVDHFRARSSQKRGGEAVVVELKEESLLHEQRREQILAIHEALIRLARLDARLATVVEYKFFGGMTEREIATALDLTTRTISSDWRAARAWLARELGESRLEP